MVRWWLTGSGVALFRGEESAQWLESTRFRVPQWESVGRWCVAGRLDFGIWLGKHHAVLLALESIEMCGRSGGGVVVVWGRRAVRLWRLGVRWWRCCASERWET